MKALETRLASLGDSKDKGAVTTEDHDSAEGSSVQKCQALGNEGTYLRDAKKPQRRRSQRGTLGTCQYIGKCEKSGEWGWYALLQR